MTPDMGGIKKEVDDNEARGVTLKRKFVTPDREQKETDIRDDRGVEHVFFPENRRKHVKRCFSDMMDAADDVTGVHPRLAEIFEVLMQHVERVGEDICRHKRLRLG